MTVRGDVSVQIDELVLVGFDQSDRELVVTALHEELAGLLSRGRPRSGGHAHAGLEYELGRDRGPEAVGRAAARSIADHLAGVRR